MFQDTVAAAVDRVGLRHARAPGANASGGTRRLYDLQDQTRLQRTHPLWWVWHSVTQLFMVPRLLLLIVYEKIMNKNVPLFIQNTQIYLP